MEGVAEGTMTRTANKGVRTAFIENLPVSSIQSYTSALNSAMVRLSFRRLNEPHGAGRNGCGIAAQVRMEKHRRAGPITSASRRITQIREIQNGGHGSYGHECQVNHAVRHLAMQSAR